MLFVNMCRWEVQVADFAQTTKLPTQEQLWPPQSNSIHRISFLIYFSPCYLLQHNSAKAELDTLHDYLSTFWLLNLFQMVVQGRLKVQSSLSPSVWIIQYRSQRIKKIPAIKQSEQQTVNIHHMWMPAFRSKVNATLLERFWAAQVVRWYKYAQRHH